MESSLREGTAPILGRLLIEHLRYVELRQPKRSVRMLALAARGKTHQAKALVLQLHGLRILSDLLDASHEVGLQPFLAFGTLLGHVRDGGFIPHDTDLDVGLLDSQADRRGELIKPMQRRGYRIRRCLHHYVSFVRSGWHFPSIDVYVLRTRGKAVVAKEFDHTNRKYHTFTYPSVVFSHFEKARFGGTLDVSIPRNPEHYLDVVYGDWSTPRTQWDKIASPANRDGECEQGQ